MQDSTSQSEKITPSTQGVDNKHDILKEAQKDDTEGMLKYGIDLDEEILKESK